jgi:hypothetical protein
MKKMLNEGNQINNLISSSGSGSDFLTSYGSGSGSGSTSQKVTVPTVPVPVPVSQRCKAPSLPRDEEAGSRAQARICRNLKYNLHQLKLQSDKATTYHPPLFSSQAEA